VKIAIQAAHYARETIDIHLLFLSVFLNSRSIFGLPQLLFESS